MSSHATLNLGGRKFVVIPDKEYRALKAKAARSAAKPTPKRRPTRQERGDVAESLRRMKEPDRRISHEELKAELGL
jgi:hypothetical protein